MNVIEYFDRGCSINPDKTAFIMGDKTWSYADAKKQTLKVGNALKDYGLRQGFHAAVLSDNHPEAFNTLLGIMRAGGVWIPVNAKNAIQAHLDFLDDSDCEVLFFSSVYEEVVSEIKGRVPGIKLYVCIDGDCKHGKSQADFVAEASLDEILLDYDPNAQCLMPGTGGTTGRPKGIVLHNRAWQTFMANMLSTLRIDKETMYLAAAPMTHAAGAYAFPVIAVGGTILFHDGFNPALFLEDIPRHKVTVTFLPPAATLALFGMPGVNEVDFSSLKHFISSAAPIPPDRVKQAIEVFGNDCWTQLYGQSECPACITILSPDETFDSDGKLVEHRLASIGRPTPFVRLGIMDGEGNLQPANERGEIVVQSDMTMREYYKNPEATAEVSGFGWHHTGDVGYLDDDGLLYIVDRTKDMIISGGLNVFPSEIEACLSVHPAVHDVAVIGVPDEKWGEAVKAVIQLKPDTSAEEEELISFCKAELGSVKAPKSVDFIDALPKSAVGKVLKKDLRAKYWKDSGRTI
jgi:acyl-CoA synthetase (AMP-forming)/AMP-acid ligase II